MFIPMNKLLWDSTAFDNQYGDIMPLVEAIRKGLDSKPIPEGLPVVQLIPNTDLYRVITGRKLSRAAAMLGLQKLYCVVLPPDADIQVYRIKETTWPPGQREGRNYSLHREGY